MLNIVITYIESRILPLSVPMSLNRTLSTVNNELTYVVTGFVLLYCDRVS